MSSDTAEDGSVFGCHCENSFPDTHNNIQCSRYRRKETLKNTKELKTLVYFF